jgi:hypothetical protein
VKTGTNERRDIEDTGRSSGCGFQHICIISCSNGGQPSGIVGVKFLSLFFGTWENSKVQSQLILYNQ